MLRQLARQAPEARVTQALANALVLELASQGWPIGEQSAALLDALLELTRARARAVSIDAPLNRPRADSGELRLSRSAEDPEHEGTPDTLVCAVGDSLRVTLDLRALTGLAAVVVEDPIPAGCEELGAELPAGLNRTVRDDLVLFEGNCAPGEKRMIHVLLAERPGIFQVPPARAYPVRLPELEARSRPLVVRILE